MSWWFAPFYDGFMRRSEEACVGAWRKELLENVSGEVLDVGAGTGANLPFFSASVEHVVATEPDRSMAKRLRARAKGAPVPVEVIEAAAEQLPFADESFDAVVSTLVLCTVDDLECSLSEIRRVLRPRGKLVFLEHVAADDPARFRWQRRFEPLWRAVAGGCHVTRRTHEAIERAGFTIESLERESVRKALPIVRPSVRGVARRA
jgi:ubiquinone/menaquinone biosynthesis C-methylase UbiE